MKWILWPNGIHGICKVSCLTGHSCQICFLSNNFVIKVNMCKKQKKKKTHKSLKREFWFRRLECFARSGRRRCRLSLDAFRLGVQLLHDFWGHVEELAVVVVGTHVVHFITLDAVGFCCQVLIYIKYNTLKLYGTLSTKIGVPNNI